MPYFDKLSEFIIINQKLNFWKRVSKFKKIKVKWTYFCIDLLFYFRAIKLISTEKITANDYFFPDNLEFELECLEEMKEFLINFLEENFKNNLEFNEDQLNNSDLGYHEYFAMIYKVER